MKSIVDIEVNRPRQEVAALMADPGNMTKWMHDLERYEHIGGDFGMPGSQYRMVPKAATRQAGFVSTVIARNLPEQLVLKLKSPMADVAVTATFTALSDRRTRLVSEEVFTFHGLFNRVFSLLARGQIKKHHRSTSNLSGGLRRARGDGSSRPSYLIRHRAVGQGLRQM
ncbi:MAG: hypothetical protein QOD94_1264, partial [Alphaproteobacteria bacterium]|nr:hypothetical protein [Alphaproteobacteria bacterium]